MRINETTTGWRIVAHRLFWFVIAAGFVLAALDGDDQHAAILAVALILFSIGDAVDRIVDTIEKRDRLATLIGERR